MPNQSNAGRLGMAFLATLLFVAPVQAQWAVASLRSIDHALGDAKYLLKLAGKEEIVTQMDGFLSAYLGKGIDTKRPLGIYLAGFGEKPSPVIFLPVTAEGDFVDLLRGFGLNLSDADKGMRTLDLPTGQKLFVRFDRNYAFACDKEEVLKSALPDPAELIGTLGQNNLLALNLRIDQIPGDVRAAFLKEFDKGIQRDMAKRDGEKEAEHQARVVGIKLVANSLLQVLTDGKDLGLALNCDQTNHQFTFDFAFSAKPGSPLASQVNELGAARSMFTGLTANSVASLFLRLPIPAQLRKEMNQLIDKAVQEAMNQEQSPIKKAIAEKVFQTLEPSLKNDTLDLAVAMHGPLGGEKYALLGALQIKEGKKIELLVRDVLQQMPEAEKKAAKVRLDLAKVGDVNIHSFTPPEQPDANAKRIFGSTEIFVAFRDDAVLVSLGQQGEGVLKKALESLAAGKSMAQGTAMPMKAEASITRLLALAPEEDQERLAEVTKLLDGKDRIRATLAAEQGQVRFRAEVSTYLVRLAGMAAEGRQ